MVSTLRQHVFLQILLSCALLSPESWRWMEIRWFPSFIVLLWITVYCQLRIVSVQRRWLLLFNVSSEWWVIITEALVVLRSQSWGQLLLGIFFAWRGNLKIVWEFMDALSPLNDHNVTFLFSFFTTVLCIKQFFFNTRFGGINGLLLVLFGFSWWTRATTMSVSRWLSWPFVTLSCISSEPVTIISTLAIFNTSVSWFFVRSSPSVQNIMVFFFINHIHSRICC